MPNLQLNKSQLQQANIVLDEIRARISEMANGDPDLLFAYRRKIFKELSYDERDRPNSRKRLKRKMLKKQCGICAKCGNPLPSAGNVLDRFSAIEGYNEKNVRLICQECDTSIQRSRGYK